MDYLHITTSLSGLQLDDVVQNHVVELRSTPSV